MTCCKRNKERACRPCWDSQTWTLDFNAEITTPDGSYSIINDEPDSTGNCPNSYSYSHVLNWNPAWGDFLNDDGSQMHRTELGDTIPKTPAGPTSDYPIRQQIISSRLYGTMKAGSLTVGQQHLVGPVLSWPLPASRAVWMLSRANAKGTVHVPDSSFFNSNYSKKYRITFGADKYGNDWNRIPKDNEDPHEGILPTNRTVTFNNKHLDIPPFLRLHEISFFGVPQWSTAPGRDFEFSEFKFYVPNYDSNGFNDIVIYDELENNLGGKELVDDWYLSNSILDRPVLVHGGEHVDDKPVFRMTGKSFGNYIDEGLTAEVTDIQTKIEGTIQENIFFITIERTLNIIGGITVTKEVRKVRLRCDETELRGEAEICWDRRTTGVASNYNFGNAIPGSLFSTGNVWWMDVQKEAFTDVNREGALLSGFISHFSVSEVGDIIDTAVFRCVSFKAYRHGSSSPFLTVLPEDGITIEDGILIDIDCQFNDLYKVTFANDGEHTTNVTNVTFERPLVTSVDKTTEEFLPFEFGTFTFEGADPGGAAPPADLTTSDLVWTHDQSGNLIPSPYTITIRSNKGIVNGGGGGGGMGGGP